MICSQCQAPLPPGSQFCSNCGFQLAGGPVATADLLMRPAAVTILGIMTLLGGALYLAMGVIFLTVAQSNGGSIVGPVALVLGTVLLIGGHGLWTLKNHGRIILIVFSIVGLLVIPIGTILSILILIYLFQPGTRVLFSDKPLNDLSREDVDALQRAKKTGVVIAVMTLVLIVGGVAFSGIIAAIAIPNFLDALNRAQAKRTMVNIEQVATQIEQYAINYNVYPTASSKETLTEALGGGLSPDLLTDGWGHEIIIRSNSDQYMICSGGKDGGECDLIGKGGPTQNENDSIVFMNGSFVQWPEGLKN